MKSWKELQEQGLNNYLKTGAYKGSFSFDGPRGADVVGNLINKTIPSGKCLDVGCGIVPLPHYMKIAESVKFTGIDPYIGDKEREFRFIQCKAESLPFEDDSFDAVLFATSLDHIEFPAKAIAEAGRVLKLDGHIFVWTAVRKKPDDNHIQNFSDQNIRSLFSRFCFMGRILVRPKINNESIYHYEKNNTCIH